MEVVHPLVDRILVRLLHCGKQVAGISGPIGSLDDRYDVARITLNNAFNKKNLLGI